MEEYLELRIKKIIRETSNSITLILENTTGVEVSYKSGQFLTFLLTMGGRELRRSYSLSSAPGIDPDLAVTITRVVNGEVSRYLMDHLKQGDILKSLYPAGRFILEPNPETARDIFLIGAGSGITPLFSILKTTFHTEPLAHITLIDSNKNEHTALFWQQLQALGNQYKPRLTSIHLFSDPLPSSLQYPVRLTIARLEKVVNENLTYKKEDARFYVCGPSTFMRMARMALVFMGFPDEVIRKENFVTQALTPQVASRYGNYTSKPVKIRYQKKEYTVEVPAQTSILRAAQAQNIQLPYSCMAGMCATCSGKCISGEAKMVVNEVLTDKEIAQGWVLTCVAFPVTEDVIIVIE